MSAYVDPAILDALVRWVEASIDGQSVLLDLTLDRPCALCGGTTLCPEGCPMAVCILDYERPWWRRERPIRWNEWRPDEKGALTERVLVYGKECDACSIYGRCLSCSADGLERRAAHKQGAVYLVDSVPMYSGDDYALTDPIRITAAQVRKASEAQRVGQLELGAAA